MRTASPMIPIAGSQSQTLTMLSAFVLYWAKRFTRGFRHRRAAASLAGLDERMLADIGLTQSDLRDAVSEPLWRDPTALLRARALERRLSRHGISFGLADAPPLAPALRSARADLPTRYTA
ncbi:MAG TPA: DUF1127 domain-containing protein [Pseudolabrys sp.]|nr:DUF1127 domain-containing protein [Pseudolabrys sp.]